MKRVQKNYNHPFGEEPKKVFLRVKMTARCLFGAPDPAVNDQIVSKVYSTKKWAFERKWNFSIDQDKPKAKTPSSNNSTFYSWIGPYEDNAPNKRVSANSSAGCQAPNRVPLLAAPITAGEDGRRAISVPESVPYLYAEVPKDVPGAEEKTESELLPSKALSHSSGEVSPTSGHFNARRISSYKAPYGSELACSPNDLVFTFPSSLKQRSITDYMKVKKLPRVK